MLYIVAKTYTPGSRPGKSRRAAMDPVEYSGAFNVGPRVLNEADCQKLRRLGCLIFHGRSLPRSVAERAPSAARPASVTHFFTMSFGPACAIDGMMQRRAAAARTILRNLTPVRGLGCWGWFLTFPADCLDIPGSVSCSNLSCCTSPAQ